ncbi:MFS transporter [Actinomyces ruminis]|uniref:MFS transporter n=1 Tax=Actinomyces ruminis TaxID=1937003 RepID=A0ABX4M925_9ACTO|nr:MFS transporter [Actinomyces ruminis]PHP51955.1 MFS transporter [Actinomyces ruminis]
MKKLLRSFGFAPRTFVQLLFITLNAQLLYAFWDIRNTLPKDFPIAMGVTDAQAGQLYSMQGLVIILGTILLGWIGDRFSVRTIMVLTTLGVGAISLFISVFSPNLSFPTLLACFFLMLLLSEVLFKPANFKAVRTSTSEDHQGAAFGFFEFGRGLLAFLVSLLWTALIAAGVGARGIMLTGSIIVLATAILVFWAAPKGTRVGDDDEVNASTIEAIKGIGRVAKLPVVWLAGLNVFCIYGTFVAAGTYFARFLQAGYGSSALVAAVFSTVVIGLRMLPLVSSVLVEKVFKSTSHFMRFMSAVLSMLLLAIAIVLFTHPASVTSFPAGNPPEHIVSSAVMPALIVLMLLASGCCFMIRGVYYAPIGEFNVPAKQSSAAMSFAITLGYIPALLGPIVFGGLIVPSEADASGNIITENLTPTSTLGAAFIGLALLAALAFCLSSALIRLKARQDAVEREAAA